MPFDGIVTKCIVNELSELLIGGRIEKIFQPEPDEIILNIRSKGQNVKLLLSASANYPRIHITEASRENPSNPPVFCMLLRKHLSGGKITGIDFYDFERIITILIESMNELGDTSVKSLTIEIMGRHSNLILINQNGYIIDSIKHIGNDVSSVREVMPARAYVLPPSQDKISPISLDIERFIHESEHQTGINIEGYLLNNIKGFSPLLCREICCRSDVESKLPTSSLSPEMADRLIITLKEIISQIRDSLFTPCIIFEDHTLDKPIDFHCLEIKQYPNKSMIPSISSALDLYYSARDKAERLKQKKSDLFKVLKNGIDRCNKKITIHQEKLREVSDREKLRLYGELILSNIHVIPKNAKTIPLLNYYSENCDEFIEISLNENLSPQENAQRYFKQYSKAKSAFSSTSIQYKETLKELSYLESVLHLLDNCDSIQEIDESRQELMEQGYIHLKRSTSKKQMKMSAPLHFKSSDGIDIFVGKNNRQNDLLTLKQSSSNDIWFHTRNIPGSHVIVKKQQQSIPDSTLLEAAILAAFHSKSKLSSNVPVDYTSVKNVKKPPGAKPGMVNYENFKTIIVTPEESIVLKLKVK